MFLLTCIKIISVILAIVGATFTIPLCVALFYHESSVYFSFLIPELVSILLFAIIFFITKKIKFQLSIKQTFIVVAFSWVTVCFMGAVPLYFSGCYSSFTNAFFESVSGFTTTGSTVCTDVEILPKSINLFRCLSHWLGGMGIVTLTVAFLPLLGVGGFQLIKAETTGPEKGKVTARITTTAKILWIIYLVFTILETILLQFFGMDFIDALSHSFSTLGTGGFSTKNTSIAYYDSVGIEVVISIFMFLSGINFSLYFYLISKKFREVITNSEFKSYILIIFLSALIESFLLFKSFSSYGDSLRYSIFQVLAIISTTGFCTSDYLLWPSAAQFILFVLFFIGGSSGSTSGGIKVARWVVIGKQLGNETKKLLHPYGIFTVRINNKAARDEIVLNVSSFLFLYLLLIMGTTLMGCFANLDIFTSITAAVSMVGNVGPAFGKLGPVENFSAIPDFLKWVYSFAMISGRLELYTILIFFVPSFWKKH